MESLKVVIADDNKKMVDVIKEVINDEPELEVVGVATNGEETIDVIKKTSPDVVLLDIIMPQLDGISVMQKVREDGECSKPDRKSTRLNSSHYQQSRMPSSA